MLKFGQVLVLISEGLWFPSSPSRFCCGHTLSFIHLSQISYNTDFFWFVRSQAQIPAKAKKDDDPPARSPIASGAGFDTSPPATSLRFNGRREFHLSCSVESILFTQCWSMLFVLSHTDAPSGLVNCIAIKVQFGMELIMTPDVFIEF